MPLLRDLDITCPHSLTGLALSALELCASSLTHLRYVSLMDASVPSAAAVLSCVATLPALQTLVFHLHQDTDIHSEEKATALAQQSQFPAVHELLRARTQPGAVMEEARESGLKFRPYAPYNAAH